jgi:hypothetical protein
VHHPGTVRIDLHPIHHHTGQPQQQRRIVHSRPWLVMIDCLDNSHGHEELRAPYTGATTPKIDYSASPVERTETTLARLTSKTRINDRSLRLLPDLSRRGITSALSNVVLRDPVVNSSAVSGLKFSAALPPQLAVDTVASRLGDPVAARRMLAEERRFVVG